MTSAFRNFFITFAICLLVFGFIGGTYVYPWLSDVLNFSEMGKDNSDESSQDITDISDGSDSSDTSEVSDDFPDNEGEYFEPTGDVFTAVIMALDDNGNVAKCVFIDENAKTRQIVYCPIGNSVKYFNEIGVQVAVKNLFAVMTPDEVCQCVTAMTGIQVDYCLVYDKAGIMSLAEQLPGIQVVLNSTVSISYPADAVAADPGPETGIVEITNSPDGYVDLKAVQYGKTNLEWLVMYGSENNYGEVCKSLLNRFIKDEKNKDPNTMAKVLNACKATNMTSDDVKTHLETIFSFDTFQYNEYNYRREVNELDTTIEEIRKLDGSFGR